MENKIKWGEYVVKGSVSSLYFNLNGKEMVTITNPVMTKEELKRKTFENIPTYKDEPSER